MAGRLPVAHGRSLYSGEMRVTERGEIASPPWRSGQAFLDTEVGVSGRHMLEKHWGDVVSPRVRPPHVVVKKEVGKVPFRLGY